MTGHFTYRASPMGGGVFTSHMYSIQSSQLDAHRRLEDETHSEADQFCARKASRDECVTSFRVDVLVVLFGTKSRARIQLRAVGQLNEFNVWIKIQEKARATQTISRPSNTTIWAERRLFYAADGTGVCKASLVPVVA
jgi:hypothetical protein